MKFTKVIKAEENNWILDELFPKAINQLNETQIKIKENYGSLGDDNKKRIKNEFSNLFECLNHIMSELY